jgi:hypothetical protein
MDQLIVSQSFEKKFADNDLAHISFVFNESLGPCKLLSSSMSWRMYQLVLSEMDRKEALTYVKHCFSVIEDEKQWLVRASEILSITGGVLVHLNAINPQRFFELEYPREVLNLIYKDIAGTLDVIDPIVCKAAASL